MNQDLRTNVLIVGAGPAGMLASALLSRLGIDHIVCEKRAAGQHISHAHVVNERSLEILRAAGFAMEELEALATPEADSQRVFFCGDLKSRPFGEIDLRQCRGGGSEPSSERACNIPQTKMEAFMAAHLEKQPHSTVLYEHLWTSAHQDEAGVVTRILDRRSGDLRTVSAQFLVAADGAGSSVRKYFGIPTHGIKNLLRFLSWRVDGRLREVVSSREGILYFLMNPECPGTIIAHDLDRYFVYYRPIFVPWESEADYSDEFCLKALYEASGVSRGFSISQRTGWTMRSQIAGTFRKRSVFLVGDAAHAFPPTGGLGMNTGLADVYNLIWKLAAIIQGHASDRLADTYEQERKPVAEDMARVSLANYQSLDSLYRIAGLGLTKAALFYRIMNHWLMDRLPVNIRDGIESLLKRPVHRRLSRLGSPHLASRSLRKKFQDALEDNLGHFSSAELTLGYRYRTGVLSCSTVAGCDDPLTTAPARYLGPGSRFPHARLESHRHGGSTLDLLSCDAWTLFMNQDGAAAKRLLDIVCQVLRGKVVCRRLAALAMQESHSALFGFWSDGAILVRPDGHIAWITQTIGQDPWDLVQAAISELANPGGACTLN